MSALKKLTKETNAKVLCSEVVY